MSRRADGLTAEQGYYKDFVAQGVPKMPGLAGVKHDSGKPRMSLLPFDALEELAKVLGAGEKKYSAHNHRSGFEYSRLTDAALRHIGAWNNGVDVDAETGISHLAHAAVNLLFLIAQQKGDYGHDDRYIKPSKKESK